MAFNKFIKSSSDLVTTHQATRAGFLSIALEKNRVSDPYVKTALSFKTMVNDVKKPEDLLNILTIRPFLISASGLSDKSLNYLDEDDRTAAIKELIENFLKPAGADFIDEVIYRYLLIKGDSVGGTMRNRIGAIGEEKLIRCILSNLSVQGIGYDWCDGSPSYHWQIQPQNDAGLERFIKALQRIRKSFGDANYSIQTSFVGAAIEKSMAKEIYEQLIDGTLSNASNLHDINQLNEYCNWIVSI